MEKIVETTDALLLEGYNDHFNYLPTDEVKEISCEEFTRTLLRYPWDHTDYKQITKQASDTYAGYSCKVWIKNSFEDEDVIGIVLCQKIDLASQSHKQKYLKFGDWPDFEKRLADQFMGDQS